MAAFVSVLLSSCVGTYQYCQVFETKPVKQDNSIKKDEGALRYENTQCVIDYNFWSNGGSADFYFYNKTDEIIYIDLAKSFFMMNGIAYDLYLDREWSKTDFIGEVSTYSYGYGESRSATIGAGIIVPSLLNDGVVGVKASKSAIRSSSVSSGRAVTHSESRTVTTKEKHIIAIPPHGRKYVKTYNITDSPMLSCDLQRYPSHSARLDFTYDNTPFRFANVISYSVGENEHLVTVSNEFYVSAVTNFAEPEIVEMKKREELCENKRDVDYEKSSLDLYDKVIVDSVCEINSSFYNIYDVKTTKKLYEKKDKNYRYDYKYNAYVLSGSNSSPLVAVGILGGILVGGIILILSGM